MSGNEANGQGAVLVAIGPGGLRDLLCENLVSDRFAIMTAAGTDEAARALRRTPPDAIVMHLSPGQVEGLELIDDVRAGGAGATWDAGLPLIALSERSEPHQAVRALERGADDVIAVPFHYPELLARLNAAMRRARGGRVGDVLHVRELAIDRNARRVFVRGQAVALAAKEFALLAALARHPARVYTKEELLRDVWGFRSMTRTRTVDSHASRLRRKLAAAGAKTGFVANVWGVGYQLVSDV
jgi:DNA-binding response OmpR family regulator